MNIPSYLKRLDDEIRSHRQEIALHQVEIARLEDARRVVVSIAEKDEAGGSAIHLPDASARPLLIVRKAGVNGTAHQPDEGDPDEAGLKRERKREKDAKAYQRRKHRERLERKLAVAKAYGASSASIDERLDAVRKERSDKGKRSHSPNGAGRHRKYMDEVQRYFLDRPATPVMTREVTTHFGVIGDKVEQQAIYQALYELRRTGFLHQSQQGEPYTLVAS